MKVKRLVIKNVLSYRERTELLFENGVNIFIGPNGGGKTNLQKILALVLSNYFIHQYEFQANDNEAKIQRLNPWTQRVIERTLQPYHDEHSDQLIELELVAEPSDLENIRTIGDNLDKFNEQLSYWESPVESYAPAAFIAQIKDSSSFVYRIANLELEEPQSGSAEWAFAQYLSSFYIFMRLSERIHAAKLSSPVFFFFSERSANRNLNIGAGNLTEQNYYQGYRNAYQAALGTNTDLMQWGAQHFARLHRRASTRAAERRDSTTADFFNVEPDVKLLHRYMQQLGYECTFFTDEDSAAYTFAMKKGDEWLTAEMFSSGEREIVHFLLAMFALNVQDGLVLVDEPELHLHPRWQQIFLHLFRDLSIERNNQFVVSTHSPVFVSADTINNITRIHRRNHRGSAKIALRDVLMPEKKNLVRMINSQNNEKIFFADKVVLVEGISDRLVMASLLEGACAKFSNHQAIEIVEVGGKNNFADYRQLLDALSTDTYIVADRDYLSTVGSDQSKALFNAAEGKAASTLLTDKKSMDRRSLLSELRSAVDGADLSSLRGLLDYISQRHSQFKGVLSDAEEAQLAEDLERLRRNRCFVLRHGEIEDYMPPATSDIRGIVAMTTDPNWVNRVLDEQRRAELATLLATILDLPQQDSRLLERQMRQGQVNFPAAPI